VDHKRTQSHKVFFCIHCPHSQKKIVIVLLASKLLRHSKRPQAVMFLLVRTVDGVIVGLTDKRRGGNLDCVEIMIDSHWDATRASTIMTAGYGEAMP
jgi:hypothetical protein